MFESHKAHSTLTELWSHQLQKEYDHINWAYRLRLIRPQIKILRASSFLGQWDPLYREMTFSENLIKHHSWHIVIEILKHEIAHQLVSDRGDQEVGHGPTFKRYCKSLGVDERFQKAQSEINFSAINFESTEHFRSESSADPESQKLMERIEKLLSLAQSKNQNEAVAAMEKVNELYEKYNIDRIQLRTQSHHYRYLVLKLNTSKVRSHFSIIASILKEHFFVDIIISDIYDPLKNKTIKTFEIFGTKENLLIAEYVFHFLNQTIEDFWQQHAKSNALEGKYKRSFQLGLLHGFNSKLRASKDLRMNSKNIDPSVSKSLALLKDNPALMEFIHQKHPRISHRSRDSGRVYGSAYSEGVENGKNIVIHKGIETTNSNTSKYYLKFKE